jgi:hypothetical protein
MAGVLPTLRDEDLHRGDDHRRPPVPGARLEPDPGQGRAVRDRDRRPRPRAAPGGVRQRPGPLLSSDRSNHERRDGERPIPYHTATRPVAVAGLSCLPATVSRQHISAIDLGTATHDGAGGPLATCEQTLAAAAFIVQSSLARSTPLQLLDHHSARARARRRPSALGAHRCSDRLLERGRAINHRAKWTCGVRFHLAEGPHRWPSRREPSERGGRSSWRLSGTATTTPIVGVSRRRPLLVPPRSHGPYPRRHSTNLTAGVRARPAHKNPRTVAPIGQP